MFAINNFKKELKKGGGRETTIWKTAWEKEGEGRRRKEKAGEGRRRQEKAGEGRRRQEKAGEGRKRQEKAGKGRRRQEKAGEGRRRQKAEKAGKGRRRQEKEGKGRRRQEKEGKGRRRQGEGEGRRMQEKEKEGEGRKRKEKEEYNALKSCGSAFSIIRVLLYIGWCLLPVVLTAPVAFLLQLNVDTRAARHLFVLLVPGVGGRDDPIAEEDGEDHDDDDGGDDDDDHPPHVLRRCGRNIICFCIIWLVDNPISWFTEWKRLSLLKLSGLEVEASLTYHDPVPYGVGQLRVIAEENLPDDSRQRAVLIGQSAGVEGVTVAHEIVAGWPDVLV